MLTKEPTPEMVKVWKEVWSQYKDRLKPNRKSGNELLDYLSGKYTLTEIQEPAAEETIRLNITLNKPLADKLPKDASPVPRAFFVENEGNGRILYERENGYSPADLGEDDFPVFVGIDLASGYFLVEGSSMLWDELYAFQGLDESDIENPFCVAEYIACLKKFHKLEDVLGE